MKKWNRITRNHVLQKAPTPFVDGAVQHHLKIALCTSARPEQNKQTNNQHKLTKFKPFTRHGAIALMPALHFFKFIPKTIASNISENTGASKRLSASKMFDSVTFSWENITV